MDLIQLSRGLPLPHPDGLQYTGIGFDSCHYYLACPGCCELVKYDLHFCAVERIKTPRPYTCLCFDPDRACFWAGAARSPYKLFQLDSRLREIDCIDMPAHGGIGGVITAVSYDCRRGGLLVCSTHAILWLCPEAPQAWELLQKNSSTWNVGAVSVAPSYLVVESRGAGQWLCVYDGSAALLCQYEIPCAYLVEAIVFSPCDVCGNRQAHFYLLATKNGCYPYLLEVCLPCPGLDICPCNHALCHGCACPPPPCPNPETVCAELLQSVALIEGALSHILNAEGEKLQKAVATTDDLDTLLCVNQSIQETIAKVTHLEIILCDKLKTIKECCCLCGDET